VYSPEEAIVKQDAESKVVVKNDCDDGIMEKINNNLGKFGAESQ